METIRHADANDIPAIRNVLGAAYSPFLETIPDLPDVTAFGAEDLVRMMVWVVEDGGGIAGVAMADSHGDTAHLANVAVTPKAAGRGLGRRLIDTVVDWARTQGLRQIDLATHPEMGNNVALYEKLGWHVTAQSDRKVTLSRPL